MPDANASPAPAQKPAVDGERTVLTASLAIAGAIAAFLLYEIITGWSGVISFFQYITDQDELALWANAIVGAALIGLAAAVVGGVLRRIAPDAAGDVLALVGVLGFLAVAFPTLPYLPELLEPLVDAVEGIDPASLPAWLAEAVGEVPTPFAAAPFAGLVAGLIGFRKRSPGAGLLRTVAIAVVLLAVAGLDENIREATREHSWLTLAPILTATTFSVLMGILIQASKPARAAALAVFGVLLTVPSLAFFAILIPIVGIGFMPPYIALTIYSILPILRNTITGLDQVDPAVMESARGMGLNRVQRILRIQLPLAWPVILTGIRVATILTISIAAIAIYVRGGGLGFFIQRGLLNFGLPNATEAIWTGTVFTFLLAILFERGFGLLSTATTSKGLQ